MTVIWNCPTGEQWSRFVMAGYLVDREILARHLETCEYCRILVARRQQELDELKKAWPADPGD